MALKEYELGQRHRAKAARNRDAAGETKLICECADLRCNATLAASAAAYANRSRGAHGFWVRPGHEIASLEQVVEENGDYAVVQNIAATPAYATSSSFAATHT
jgi:hypothetical protein